MPDRSTVDIVTGTGEVKELPKEYALDLASSDARKATKAESTAAQKAADAQSRLDFLVQKHNAKPLEQRIGESLLAGSAGVARGLTGGLSDLALDKATDLLEGNYGLSKVSALGALKDEYAGASDVGEAAGLVGGLALGSGEAGLAAKTVSAVPRGIGAAGELAGGAARFALGGERATGLAARTIQRGAELAATGATEGALYGAGNAVSESALGNTDLTGEKLVAGMGHGALVGGVLGGTLGGIGGALERTPASAIARAASEGEATTGRPARLELGKTELRTRSLGQKLEDFADEKVIKSMGGSAGDLRKLEDRYRGGAKRFAQEFTGDYEARGGGPIGLSNRQKMNDFANARLDELGERQGQMLRDLDKAKVKGPDVEAFAKRVEDELIKPNIARVDADGTIVFKPNTEHIVGEAQKQIASFRNAYAHPADAVESMGAAVANDTHATPTTSFQDWFQERKKLDKLSKWDAATPSEVLETRRAIRGMMEDELLRAGEEGSAKLGRTFADEYRAVKGIQETMYRARDMTERGLSRQGANNTFGLGSMIAGGAGLAAGGPIAGAALGLLGKLVKSHSDQLAADALYRASSLLGTQRVASRVDGQIEGGVARFLGTSAPAKAELPSIVEMAPQIRKAATGYASRHDMRKDFLQSAAAVLAAHDAGPAAAQQIRDRFGDVATHAPNTVQAATDTTMRGIAFLQSKLPALAPNKFDPTPQFDRPLERVSDTEVSTWLKYKDGVEHPLSILVDAKDGSLSYQKVEAVRTVYPQLYAQMQGTVMTSLQNARSAVPYRKRIQLGMLLGIPTDPSLDPQFETAIQNTFEPEQAEKPQPSASSLKAPLAVAESSKTQTEKVEASS